jgi:hypothetical protein
MDSNRSPETAILYACCRQAFTDAQRETVAARCASQSIDWETVCTGASANGVAPLIWANLQQCQPAMRRMPRPTAAHFEQLMLNNVALATGMGVRLAESLAFFVAQGIEVLLVKGAALDLTVYRQPWYTVHDVDLVWRPAAGRAGAVDRQLLDDWFGRRHGFEYERMTHHDLTIDGVLPVDFDLIWTDATLLSWRGQRVFVMCPEDMLVAACINSCRKRYTRLKAVFDIAEITHAYPGLAWDKVQARATAFACRPIVYAALLATQQTLGLALPDGFLDTLQIAPVRSRLIRWLVEHPGSLHSPPGKPGSRIFDREVNGSLVLPYVTYSAGQVAPRLRHLWRTRGDALGRAKWYAR